MPPETLLEWTHPAGDRRIRIARAASGMVRYTVEARELEEATEDWPYASEHWRGAEAGGLYLTLEAALADAARSHAWIGEVALGDPDPPPDPPPLAGAPPPPVVRHARLGLALIALLLGYLALDWWDVFDPPKGCDPVKEVCVLTFQSTQP